MESLKKIAGISLLVLYLVLINGCSLPVEIPQSQFQEKENSTVMVKPKAALSKQSERVRKEVQSISNGKYAYENLSAEGKRIYDQMLQSIMGFTKKAALSTTDTELMKQAYAAMNSDYGNLFWVEGYVFTMYTKGDKMVGLEFSPNYTMSRAKKEKLQQRIDRVAEQWMMGISQTDSDYEKLKYVFETLIQKVDYEEGASDSQNIISVFLNRETVCQGYACAAQFLLDRLGVPSVVITGQANGQSHAWNLVKLEGKYYHMDATWGNSTYLNGKKQEAKFVNYSYLTMTTKELQKTHQPSRELPLPNCRATENSYYVKENRYFEAWQPEQMGAILQESWMGERAAVTIKFATAELLEQAKEYFIVEQKVADYCPGISNIFYSENRDLLVLLINF